MIVVSDSSPITNLIQIGQESLLEALFKSVVIPPSVQSELHKTHASLPLFIQVSAPTDNAFVIHLQKELDAGEAEAIALAKELKADLILIDERLGRAVVEREGFRFTGLLGVLIEAKKRGLISAITPLITDLEAIAGFRLSKATRAEAMRLANEDAK